MNLNIYRVETYTPWVAMTMAGAIHMCLIIRRACRCTYNIYITYTYRSSQFLYPAICLCIIYTYLNVAKLDHARRSGKDYAAFAFRTAIGVRVALMALNRR